MHGVVPFFFCLSVAATTRRLYGDVLSLSLDNRVGILFV
jgi:hypothetical protein